MKQSELDVILRQHELWLTGNGGKRANLSCANLSGVCLGYADLMYADLTGANLSNANLSGANLSNTNGFDVSYQFGVKCQYFVGISKQWDIITIGCKTHTALEWKEYLNSGKDLYLRDCRNIDEYNKCIDVIIEGIKYIEGDK